MSSFVCTNLTPTVAVHSHMLPHLTLPWTAHAATLDAAFVCMCYLHLLMSQHLMLSFVCAYFTLTVAFYCKCPNTNVVVCLHMFHTYFCRSFAHAATLDAAFICTRCHTWCYLWRHVLPTFVNVPTLMSSFVCTCFTPTVAVHSHTLPHLMLPLIAHAATLDAAFVCTCCLHL